MLNILKKFGITLPEEILKATELTRYAFEVRYPYPYIPVSREEYEEAYEIAVRVYEWAKGIVENTP